MTFAQLLFSCVVQIDMLIKPTPDWGPASNQDRSLIANYVANFIVDAEAARLSAQHQKNNPTSARVVYQVEFLTLLKYCSTGIFLISVVTGISFIKS